MMDGSVHVLQEKKKKNEEISIRTVDEPGILAKNDKDTQQLQLASIFYRLSEDGVLEAEDAFPKTMLTLHLISLPVGHVGRAKIE